MKLAERTDIPALEGGWINLTEAADRLGYTRSYMYKLATADKFPSIRRIGSQDTFVINEKDVTAILDARTEGVQEQELTLDSIAATL